MRFDGTILITDPCYFVLSDSDWHDSKFGADMGALGFSHYLYVDAGEEIGGTVRNTDTGEVLGEFCTDSCVVVVAYYDDVIRYNPEHEADLAKYPNSGAVIRDFHGDIGFDFDDNVFFGIGNVNWSTDEIEEDEKDK